MNRMYNLYEGLTNVEVEFNSEEDVVERQRLVRIYKDICVMILTKLSSDCVQRLSARFKPILDTLVPSDDLKESPLYGQEFNDVIDVMDKLIKT